MKRLLRALLLLTTGFCLIATPVLALSFNVQVVESNGTAHNMIPITFLEDNIGNGYGMDTRVQDILGTNLPHMVADDRTIFASAIGANSTTNFGYLTGQAPLANLNILVGQGGSISVSDDASMEMYGYPWSLETTGYIDTTTNGIIFDKLDALSLYTDSGDIKAALTDFVNYRWDRAIYSAGYIYLASLDDRIITRIDTASLNGIVLFTGLNDDFYDMCISGTTLYALGMRNGNVSISTVDLTTFTETVCATVTAAATDYYSMVVSGAYIYACSTTDKIVDKIEISSTSVVDSYNTNDPRGKIIYSGGYVYALGYNGGTTEYCLEKIDVTGMTQSATDDIGAFSLALLAADGTYLYASRTRTLYRFALSDLASGGTLDTGVGDDIASGVVSGTDMYLGMNVTGAPFNFIRKVDLTTFTNGAHLNDTDATRINTIVTDGTDVYCPDEWTNGDYIFVVNIGTYTETGNIVPPGDVILTLSSTQAAGIYTVVIGSDGAGTYYLDIDGGAIEDTATYYNGIRDNANDITIMSDVVPYIQNIDLIIDSGFGDVDSLHFEPDARIAGTTMPDVSGLGNDGTITWGINYAGITPTLAGTYASTLANLIATPKSSTQIKLTWTRDAVFTTTRVLAKAGSYPTSVTDATATVIYEGIAQLYFHNNLTPGTTYYYRAWSVTDLTIPLYSSNYIQDYATTLIGSAVVPDVIMPGDWFQTPTCTAYSNLPFLYDLIVRNTTAWGMPLATGCVIVTFGWIVVLSGLVRISTHTNMLTLIGLMIFLGVAISAKLLPGFFWALELILGGFTIFIWRRM
jgi:hypothetical protein